MAASKYYHEKKNHSHAIKKLTVGNSRNWLLLQKL